MQLFLATLQPPPDRLGIDTVGIQPANRSRYALQLLNRRNLPLILLQTPPGLTGKTVRQGAERDMARTAVPAPNPRAFWSLARISAVLLHAARPGTLTNTLRRSCILPAFCFNIFSSGQIGFIAMLHWPLTARRCQRAGHFFDGLKTPRRKDARSCEVDSGQSAFQSADASVRHPPLPKNCFLNYWLLGKNKQQDMICCPTINRNPGQINAE